MLWRINQLCWMKYCVCQIITTNFINITVRLTAIIFNSMRRQIERGALHIKCYEKESCWEQENQLPVRADRNWLQTRWELELSIKKDSSHLRICHGSRSPQSIKEMHFAIFCKMEVTFLQLFMVFWAQSISFMTCILCWLIEADWAISFLSWWL